MKLMTQTKTNEETRVAEEIASVLEGAVRECCDDRDSVRFAVRGDGLRLRSIVFKRSALRKLAADPLRAVKVEYLRRDLEQSATQREEYRYPRPRVAPRSTTTVYTLPAMAIC